MIADVNVWWNPMGKLLIGFDIGVYFVVVSNPSGHIHRHFRVSDCFHRWIQLSILDDLWVFFELKF